VEFENLVRNLLDKFKSLPKPHQLIIGGTLLSVLLFLVLLSVFSTGKEDINNGYKVLFDNLEPKDTALIIAELEKDEIPYILTKKGIKVPKKHVHRQRIELASMDLPKSRKKIGYALFDERDFGSTDFEQKIKHLRSLEGELSNTLESLVPIDRASVHIAIPNESVFVAKKLPTTASVMIELAPNMVLSNRQVKGIKYLISASVSKLSFDNVKIVNNQGEPLGVDDETTYIDELSKMQAKYKTKEEFKLEKKIIALLSPFLGGEKSVIAKVNIDFDFTRTDTKSEEYSPNTVVRSKQSLEEKKEGYREENKGGVPGAVSNIGPIQGIQNKDKKNKYSKNEATVNYEISKKVSNIYGMFATIKRINVGVVIDGKHSVSIVDGDRKHIYEKRSDEDLKKVESLVKQAMGFQNERKDEITVTSFKFDNPRLAYIKTLSDKILALMSQYAQSINYIIAAIILFVFYKTVLAQFVDKMLELPSDDLNAENSIIKLGEIEQDEGILNKSDDMKKRIANQLAKGTDADEDKVRHELIIEKLQASFMDNPEQVALFLSSLVRE